MTDTPSPTPEVCSLYTIKLALEKLRDHALRVRDTAQSSAVQLAGPSVARDLSRKPEVKPDQGINSHLLSLVDDIEAVLGDCDDFAESILVLTGKWEEGEQGQRPEPTAFTVAKTVGAAAVVSALPESAPTDKPSPSVKTGLAELVATVAGTRAEPGA